jgi:hypothetical protein
LPGKLVEVDETQRIFSNPSVKATEDLHLRPLRLTTLDTPDGP